MILISVSCVALSGLGGHAFGSFKERGGNHMWLRDALPVDLPGVRVWIYGYDTKLAASTSFQDLEALASNFRRVLISARRRTSVRLRASTSLFSATYRLSANRQKAVQPHLPLVFIAHSLGGLVLKEVSGTLINCLRS